MGWMSKSGTAVALILGFLNVPVAAQAETLADAMAGAYEHSGLLDQNRALLRAADEDVALAVSALKPILNWQTDITRTFGSVGSSGNFFGSPTFTETNLTGTSATLSLIGEVLLYDFGAAESRVEASKEVVLATRSSLLAIEQSILLQAVTAFMSVRQASEFVALRQNNLRLLTEELRAARDRFEVGEVTRTDVVLAEARLAQARSGLASSQRDLLQAQEFYRNVVGRKPGRLVAPPRIPQVERNVGTAKAIAVRNHPELASAQHEVAAFELLMNAADRDMYPTITLNGRLSFTDEYGIKDYTRSGSVGVQATGPIYNGGRLSSAKRQAMANRDASRGNLHVVRHNVQQDVGDAIADLLAAQAQLEASERQIRASRTAFRGVREEAKLGARTTLEVLDAEQELLDAEAARIQAQAEQYVAAYSVLESMGKLTAQQLGLAVQIYDPAAYYNLVKDAPAQETRQGKQLDRVLRALQKD